MTTKLGKNMINKNTVIYIVIGILLITIMTFIGTGVFVRVLVIEISGAHMYTEEEVLEASRVSRGDNLMRINAQTVSQNIRAGLPFVSDVVIERRFPDTLFIEIIESEPIAYATFDGNTIVMDSSGRVLQSGDYSTENLIEIRGLAIRDASLGRYIRPEAGAETRFQDMQEILAAFERENIKSDVSYLDISNIQNIHFGYMGIYRVLLGNAGELRLKLHNLGGAVDRLSVEQPGIAGDINLNDPAGGVFSPTHDTPNDTEPGQTSDSAVGIDPDLNDTDIIPDESNPQESADEDESDQAEEEN